MVLHTKNKRKNKNANFKRQLEAESTTIGLKQFQAGVAAGVIPMQVAASSVELARYAASSSVIPMQVEVPELLSPRGQKRRKNEADEDLVAGQQKAAAGPYPATPSRAGKTDVFNKRERHKRTINSEHDSDMEEFARMNLKELFDAESGLSQQGSESSASEADDDFLLSSSQSSNYSSELDSDAEDDFLPSSVYNIPYNQSNSNASGAESDLDDYPMSDVTNSQSSQPSEDNSEIEDPNFLSPQKKQKKDRHYTSFHVSPYRENEKSTLYVDPEFVRQNGLDMGKVENQFANVPGHRSIGSVLERTPGGGPKTIETPNGSKLGLRTHLGNFRVFTNSDGLEYGARANKMKSDERAIVSKKLIMPPKDNAKVVVTTVTESSLDDCFAERKKTNNYRSPSQQQAVTVNGGEVSAENAYKAYTDNASIVRKGLQWLHLIAWSIVGKSAQIQKNLVIGTTQSNDLMQVLEQLVEKLCRRFSESVKIYAEGLLQPGTHIGDKINYFIEIGNRALLPFTFNAFETKKPKAVTGEYLDILVDGLFQNCTKVITAPASAVASVEGPVPMKHADKVVLDRMKNTGLNI